MSQKQIKQESPGMRAAKGGGSKKNDKNINNKPEVDSKFKENVVRKLYDSFQDSFSLEQISAVAHTCQWDLCRATEALMILGDTPKSKKGKNAKGHHNDLTKNKTKSLPSTLKSHSHKSSESLYATPNGLRSNPAHVSTNSLSSGQVWQRHYKSKPQSPGLLTMIPPHVKEVVKLKKTGSARSLPSTSSIKKESPEVKKASAAVLRIQQLVQDGVKVLVLMRGVPGSGKTHLAQVVVGLVTSNELSQHIFSTDDYFILLGRGHYAYDSNQLPQAHNWNQKRVSEALRRATNPVIVDNTHTQAWEMQAYVAMAVQHGYLIEVLEPVTPWRKNEAELAKRNIHSVPREKIRQMLDKYEPGWTGEKLLQLFGLKYVHCGAAHVPHELTSYSNSPLAQHRQHSVIETPEKPKRKKNNTKKKDRRALAGIEITEDTEKQLNELNQLFAEYGKKLDPVSKKIVLESGVPISEVIARLRKKQGVDIPLPKTNVPPTIPETGRPMAFYDNHVIKPVPNYPRDSPSESLEPDTMSSSNASETSECETDTDAELQGLRNYIGYGCGGRFVEGEDAWEDYDDDEGRAKSAGAVGGKSSSKSSSKMQSLVTSSQEELSLIDFELSTTHTTRSSADDLSLIDFDGDDSPNAKGRSSSSSEEQETQLLTLQESLREVLIDNFEKRRCLENAHLAEQKVAQETQDKNDNKPDTAQIELTDSLLEVMNKRFLTNEEKTPLVVDRENNVVESKKSPDLEEIPLPSIPPPNSKEDKVKQTEEQWRNHFNWANPPDKLEEIMNSWEHPPEPQKDYSSPKPARPKNSLLGAIKKTGIQRDKSPEELLRSIELSWASIPFTSSWENINKKPGDPEMCNFPKPQRKMVEKSDSSTNTDNNDFELWKSEKEGIIKLTTHSRNINQNLVSQPIPQISQIPDVLMLDKGSMTADADDFDPIGFESAMENLSNMFPDLPRDHLSDILEKCKGNIHWAVELLLESAQNIGTASYLKDKPSSSTSEPVDGTTSNIIPSNIGNLISDGKKTIKRRKDKKNVPSELSLLLKKQIEESIHINEESYNDKTLFLKKLRHGEIDLDAPFEPFIEPSLPPEPLLPDVGDGLAETTDFLLEEEEKKKEKKEKKEEDDEEEEEETIPMSMDPKFFEALVQRFGSSEPSSSQKSTGFIPVINIPVSLAHQIYCCWLETVNRQVEEMENIYEKMIKEDEMLAAALQEEEHGYKNPDLREIMDMELAMALYRQDQEQFQENTQDTIASKLSKQLLFEAYPNADKKILLDLFRSQGNSLQKTVNILNCQEDELPKTVMSQEFINAYEQNLLEQAKRESLKKVEETAHKPIIIIREESPRKMKTNEAKDVLVVNPAEFRQKISLLHQRRNDCCRLAQEARRKKSYSVASYFSHLATLYKDKIQDMESNAISLKLFEEKEDEVLTKIDLHYLFVNEALQVLDLFLDHHIKQLNKKGGGSTELFLITGRGQRSFKGKSRIKPAVKKRLDERKLNYVEDNPGMLKVVIRKGDQLSDQL